MTPEAAFSRGEYRFNDAYGPDCYRIETADRLRPAGDGAFPVMRYAGGGVAGVAFGCRVRPRKPPGAPDPPTVRGMPETLRTAVGSPPEGGDSSWDSPSRRSSRRCSATG